MSRQVESLKIDNSFGLLAWSENQAKVLDARAIRNAELKRKYRRAARYPWLPVEPDPPEPPDARSAEPEDARQADFPAARSSYGLIVMPPRIENGAP